MGSSPCSSIVPTIGAHSAQEEGGGDFTLEKRRGLLSFQERKGAAWCGVSVREDKGSRDGW